MIPLRDNIPSRTTPFVNYALIVLCVLGFFVQAGGSTSPTEPSLAEQLGMVPARVLAPDQSHEIEFPVPVRLANGQTVLRKVRRELAPAAVPDWLTLLTCIFLHGSWLHLLGNVWFLYIFGDNVEDRLGHLGYLAFYLGTGVLASVVHLVSAADSTLPTVGASGAIAGVMGAYSLLYPRATVMTLVPLIIIFDVWVLPARIFLGVWFGFQLLQGSLALGAGQSGGVAWWAHIGGFVAGFAVALVLNQMKRTKPAVVEVRPRTRGFSRYGQYGLRRRRGPR